MLATAHVNSGDYRSDVIPHSAQRRPPLNAMEAEFQCRGTDQGRIREREPGADQAVGTRGGSGRGNQGRIWGMELGVDPGMELGADLGYGTRGRSRDGTRGGSGVWN